MKTDLTYKASVVVRVLEMTMQGVPVKDISDRLGIKHVRDIQNAHGYPNERTMLDQVRQLLPLRDQTVTFDTDLTPEPPRAAPSPPTRPAAAPVAARPAATPPPAIRVEKVDDLQRLLDDATKHERPAIAHEAERILARIARLREALAEVDADTKRLAEIAELEKRLAELRGVKSARSRAKFTHPCDQCDKVATSGAGLAAHKRGAHGGAS